MSATRTSRKVKPQMQIPPLIEKTTSSIEEAIGANLSLQGEIIKKLRLISKAKKKNRMRSLQLTGALFRHIHDDNLNSEAQKDQGIEAESEDETETGNAAKKKGSRKRKRKAAHSGGGYQGKVWHENTDRKWKRRFFVDPDRSVPQPNPDEIQRRKWEGTLLTSQAHRFLPWSKDEIKLLQKNAEEVRNEQLEEMRISMSMMTSSRQQQNHENGHGRGIDTSSNGPNNDETEIDTDTDIVVHDGDIDFHKVAEKMAVDLRAKKYTPNQKIRNATHCYSQMESSNIETAEPRTWVDYRIKFLTSVSPSINKRPFTKAESLKIIEALHRHNGKPPWHIVAHELQTSRTPFQCFQHARTKLINSIAGLDASDKQLFNIDQDELLFKFVAASGPQFVLGQHSSTLLAQRFFPHVSAYQVKHRANVSLINPQFVMERWNETEERTLVMSMKAYSESDTPLARAAGLLEHRSFKSVADKWMRCLNPCWSTQPFTVREDKALLKAVKDAKVPITVENWKEVISDQFPTRSPRSLMYHWVELCQKEDVLKLSGSQLLQKGLRSIGRKTKGSNANVTGGEDLDADDFVLRVKKKKRVADTTEYI